MSAAADTPAQRAEAGASTLGTDARPLAVSATGLTKSFKGFTAVDGVDLSVRQGEVVAFLGPNGAGKTSTIDMLLGLSQPDRGDVRLFGLTPRQAIGRGLVSAVMQTGGLLSDISVRDTMKLTASLFAQSTDIDAALQRAGILEIADRKIVKCSGGQQQRLRFAMALLSDPGLIVLDEPTTGMDVEGRRSFWQAIHSDAQRGRTVLFATHYLEEADQYADRIILIRKGRIVADGTTAEIKAMAAGRTIEAEWGSAEEANGRKPEIAALREVDSVTARGSRLLIHATDSDAVARYLLTSTQARDITITSQNLEQAFLRLTGDGEARGSEEDAA